MKTNGFLDAVGVMMYFFISKIVNFIWINGARPAVISGLLEVGLGRVHNKIIK